MCLHRLGDESAAESDFDRAVGLAPTDFRVFYNAACYWAERADEKKCRALFETAMSLAPASFVAVASVDPDLARYSGREWFREILAAVRRRGV
jgi:hypothetical protein